MGTHETIIDICRTLARTHPEYETSRAFNPTVADYVPRFTLKGAEMSIDAPPAIGGDAKIMIYEWRTDLLKAAADYGPLTFRNRSGEISHLNTPVPNSYVIDVQVQSTMELENLLNTFAPFAHKR